MIDKSDDDFEINLTNSLMDKLERQKNMSYENDISGQTYSEKSDASSSLNIIANQLDGTIDNARQLLQELVKINVGLFGPTKTTATNAGKVASEALNEPVGKIAFISRRLDQLNEIHKAILTETASLRKL